MRHFSLARLGALLSSSVKNELQVSGYQIDSRLIQKGDLFFALMGEKTDGHLHLEEVSRRGGIAAVVSNDYSGPNFGLELLRVRDAGGALRLLAKKDLESTPRVQIVGITGSVGKTTTKDFIATLLDGKYRVVKTIQSQNSKLTLPLTILNRDGDEDILVLEMGMSEPGDIGRLVEVAPPDVAVLTKIAYAHALYFPEGIEQIAKGKGEIFHVLKTKIAIFDDSYLPYSQTISIERCHFSMSNKQADFFLSASDEMVKIYRKNVLVRAFHFPYMQSHFLHNFLAAICVAIHLGMKWSEIEAQIPNLQLPKMRFEQKEKDGSLFINDAYNANPESMKAALSSMPNPKGVGKKIAVLGTMKELGHFSCDLHKEVGRFAQDFVDHLLVFGEEAIPIGKAFESSKKPVEYFLDHASLASRLKQIVNKDDVVLIKGSRSMSMEKILELVDC